MRRRKFISVIGGAALAWPLAARAMPEKKWLIGFIAHMHLRSYDSLFDGLRELGYVEGQNIVVERRYAEGSAERFQDFAREMVQRKADAIVVVTTPAALAVMKETTTTPIGRKPVPPRQEPYRRRHSLRRAERKAFAAAQGDGPRAFPDGCPLECGESCKRVRLERDGKCGPCTRCVASATRGASFTGP